MPPFHPLAGTYSLYPWQALMPPFRVQLAALAERHGERLLHTPNNTISMAITLSPEEGGLYPLWRYSLWLYLLG